MSGCNRCRQLNYSTFFTVKNPSSLVITPETRGSSPAVPLCFRKTGSFTVYNGTPRTGLTSFSPTAPRWFFGCLFPDKAFSPGPYLSGRCHSLLFLFTAFVLLYDSGSIVSSPCGNCHQHLQQSRSHSDQGCSDFQVKYLRQLIDPGLQVSQIITAYFFFKKPAEI